MMAQITFEELPLIRKRHLSQKIVFCSGCFDLTHAGHILFFEDCKKYGDILVVMIGSDKVVRRDKGNKRPILNEHTRIKLIDSLKPVDYCFLDFIISPDTHPLKFIDLAIEKLKPDVYAINEDAWDITYRKDFMNKHKTELVILKRSAPAEFKQISTTGIIEKIKKLDL